jgi:hypothetical protein
MSRYGQLERYEIDYNSLRARRTAGPGEWRRRDSNPRLPACKAGAVATEPRPHGVSNFETDS